MTLPGVMLWFIGLVFALEITENTITIVPSEEWLHIPEDITIRQGVFWSIFQDHHVFAFDTNMVIEKDAGFYVSPLHESPYQPFVVDFASLVNDGTIMYSSLEEEMNFQGRMSYTDFVNNGVFIVANRYPTLYIDTWNLDFTVGRNEGVIILRTENPVGARSTFFSSTDFENNGEICATNRAVRGIIRGGGCIRLAEISLFEPLDDSHHIVQFESGSSGAIELGWATDVELVVRGFGQGMALANLFEFIDFAYKDPILHLVWDAGGIREFDIDIGTGYDQSLFIRGEWEGEWGVFNALRYDGPVPDGAAVASDCAGRSAGDSHILRRLYNFHVYMGNY